MLIAALFGSGIGVLILALGFLYGVAAIRITLATTLDYATRNFVLAAYAMGRSGAPLSFVICYPCVGHPAGRRRLALVVDTAFL